MIKDGILLRVTLGVLIANLANAPTAQAQTKEGPALDIYEELQYVTVQIVAENTAHKVTSFGTGFFFEFSVGDQNLTLLVTNKHVVKGSDVGHIRMHTADENNRPSPEGQNFNIADFQKAWINHPDPKIDLCAMPIQRLRDAALTNGKALFIRSLMPAIVPDSKTWEELRPVQQVIMIGYPIGLSDTVHNFPLFRQGITATKPSVDFQGRPEFVIDIAAWPGSSGSPVLLNESGIRPDGQNLVFGTPRMLLVGILYGGPRNDVSGDIVISTIPTANVPRARTDVPANLGFVIKADQLLRFLEVFVATPKN